MYWVVAIWLGYRLVLYCNNWFIISAKSGCVIVTIYLTFLTIIRNFYTILGCLLFSATGGIFTGSGIYCFLPL